MAFWSISVTPERMRTMQRARSGRSWGPSTLSAVWMLNPASSKAIGIATGLVVSGDLIGKGSAQEHSVVGETPNPPSRLQALAEPVIAAGSRGG
jgi:hypothetical protein